MIHQNLRYDDHKDEAMIYDFNQTCNTYDAYIYNKDHFKATPCPKCPGVGRFTMHGCYSRYVIYFTNDEKIICEQKKIKRIYCTSCKSTHAVMPGDIIPYKILSLIVFIHILVSFYLEKVPVQEVAKKLDFSVQFIYSVMRAFQKHLNNVRQYIKETYPEDVPAVFDVSGVLSYIKGRAIDFQAGYIEKNRKACFMCKMFNKTGAPPAWKIIPYLETT